MPIHAPGPRLYRSIPFAHLAQASTHARRAVNVSLNVTPFVDMMTILVVFLMMVFSASGELISAQRGLTLPDATQVATLRKAPIIIVTKDDITFNGAMMTTVSNVMSSQEFKIPELFERLKAEKTAFKLKGFDQLSEQEKKNCQDPTLGIADPNKICLDGLLILQGEKETDAKVLFQIIKTAQAAEYQNIQFAANRRAARR